MSAIRSPLLAGYRAALGQAGVSVTFRYRTFTTEDAMDPSEQYTTSTEYARGLFSNEPVQGMGDRLEGKTNRTRLTVAMDALSARPNVGTVIVAGSEQYIVTDISEVQGALYVCDLSGPSVAGTVASDITPPRFTATDATGSTDSFSYTATSNESVYHRYRYRIGGGAWSTSSYNGTLQTSIGGSSGTGLNAGVYEVAIQGKDAADNESAWTDCGSATVTGTPA